MDSVCIILIKMVGDENSRFYLDYTSQAEAVQGLIGLYEQMLRKKNPDKVKLNYSLADVLEFLDKLNEITFLQYDPAVKGFKPHGRVWIKSIIVQSYTAKA